MGDNMRLSGAIHIACAQEDRKNSLHYHYLVTRNYRVGREGGLNAQRKEIGQA